MIRVAWLMGITISEHWKSLIRLAEATPATLRELFDDRWDGRLALQAERGRKGGRGGRPDVGGEMAVWTVSRGVMLAVKR